MIRIEEDLFCVSSETGNLQANQGTTHGCMILSVRFRCIKVVGQFTWNFFMLRLSVSLQRGRSYIAAHHRERKIFLTCFGGKDYKILGYEETTYPGSIWEWEKEE